MPPAPVPPWVHLLDEYAIHPDPMPWYRVVGLRITIPEQKEAADYLLERGWIAPAGRIREEWGDLTYGITTAGRAYWRKHVEGKRVRPKTADPVPRYSIAQMAAASGPREVWDLVQMPWRWHKKREQMREFGEVERPMRKKYT